MGFLRYSQLATTPFGAFAIGGGGRMSGLDIAPDGTTVCRTDAYGAYRWNGSAWVQLFTEATLPNGDATFNGINCFGIVIAPNLTSRLYGLFNGYVYRSDNNGANWTRTAFTQITYDPNEDDIKSFDPKMAVDPNNPDICYCSTPSAGCFVTFDAGSTWTQVSVVGTASVPSGKTNGGGHQIVFDTSGGTITVSSQTRTANVLIATYGTGLYRSTGGGVSWTLLNTTGMPTTIAKLRVSSTGKVFAVLYPLASTLKTWTPSTWNTVSYQFGMSAYDVAVDPANANFVVAVDSGGSLAKSTDAAVSFDGSNAPASVSRTATDVPWLAWTQESFFSANVIKFDPSRTRALVYAEGIGMWEASLATAYSTPITWTDKSAGTDNMVTNWIVSPPGGNPVMAFWDRPFFTGNGSAYPSTHGVVADPADTGLHSGWSCDYASATPSFIVGIANPPDSNGSKDTSGYSTDGGATWSQFAAKPSNLLSSHAFGGCIAASTTTNVVWAESDGGAPYYTTNGGAAWSACSFSGVTLTIPILSAAYRNAQIVCADRVTANKFYLYSGNIGDGTDRVMVSTNSGQTFTPAATPNFIGSRTVNAKMRTVPGNAGHLFFSSGDSGGPSFPDTSQPLYRSTNSGATWADVSNGSYTVREARCFGFGLPKPGGGGYPSIYIYGWVNGVGGTWRSDDNCATWVQISDLFPGGRIDFVKCVEGDNSVYGRCYVGFAGSSVLRIG